ncbi:hypothetical protein VB776_17565 [Arcicella sp. DC2W]|uniref:TIGR02646 family protein n=1 Tax=Arcicella gelida TaxID=2984195 RepID=A0ABU5S8E4_9BACT|nr:hypothetical protein [Arcicella sp. DC2W]MEA5404747.1 hypothetical protein [Arcicella sp. DC2W]
MRKVVKDLEDIPAPLVSQEAIDSLQNIISTKNKKLITSDIYRGKYLRADGSKGDAVVEKLDEIYQGKCAYCEERTSIYIEHYRPKGRVLKTNHGGYYWLCYEWTNLLPTCHECNKIGGGKADQFPVKNKHFTFEDCKINQKLDSAKVKANYLNQHEAPFLLHPEIDEPKEFLAFEIETSGKGISMIGLDGINGRGFETIRICNLNRQPLLLNRLDYINDYISNRIKKILLGKYSKPDVPKHTFKSEIKELFEDLDKDKVVLTKPLTLLRWFVMESVDNFQKLIINKLPKKEQDVILAYFQAYKNGDL